MKSTSKLFLSAIAIALLAACGKPNEAPEAVSFATLEDARAQARTNGEYNAQVYRADNPRFDSRYKIIPHGDSTQTNECPQGDGWATNTIMAVDNKAVDKYSIKCSTVSATLGCYLDEDFAKKSFAAEEGKCQPTSKVPFPLPKLTK